MRPTNVESLVPFIMLKHGESKSNNDRYHLLTTSLLRQPKDGLSNIHELVKVVKTTYFKTFTHLLIDVGY